ncbi:MAG: hypothetical protein MZW92_80250 [Comamonadaceae bacterium]|nr:hypothetical protein [Comamonadaceae bacterium]
MAADRGRGCSVLMPPPSQMTNGHLGLLMLALIVVAIMLGFPTAFTLMGMGMFFAWLAYRSANPTTAMQQTLDLMVQRAYCGDDQRRADLGPAVRLHGLPGRARQPDREAVQEPAPGDWRACPARWRSRRCVTCAIFATATGIVGAVVTLMGLLAFPAMLRARLRRPALGRRDHRRAAAWAS